MAEASDRPQQLSEETLVPSELLATEMAEPFWDQRVGDRAVLESYGSALGLVD